MRLQLKLMSGNPGLHSFSYSAAHPGGLKERFCTGMSSRFINLVYLLSQQVFGVRSGCAGAGAGGSYP